MSILTRRGCCSLTHEGHKEVVEEGVHFTCGKKVFVCLAAEERSSQNRKRQFELSEFTVWCDTFLLTDVYNKRMNVKLLDVFFKWCLIHVFFALFSLFILGEAVIFSSSLSFYFFCSADGQGGPCKGLWEAFRRCTFLTLLPQASEVKRCWDSLKYVEM